MKKKREREREWKGSRAQSHVMKIRFVKTKERRCCVLSEAKEFKLIDYNGVHMQNDGFVWRSSTWCVKQLRPKLEKSEMRKKNF